jgi:ribosomal-protein-alanine N-acetyltransferase
VAVSRPAATCRPLYEKDIEGLLQFLPASLPGPWHREALLGSAWEQRVLVTPEAAGTPVGYAEFYVAADECHLLNIAIAPGSQGQGLGTHLLATILAEAVQRGCRVCLLEVRASNAAAKALYGKAGFVLAGTRKGYYPASVTGQAMTPGRQGSGGREDALLYSLELSSLS